MHILFFTRRFYPDIGGVETHVMEVGKRLVSMGHEVTVVCEESSKSSSTKRFWASQNDKKIKIWRIPVGRHEKQKKFIIWQWLKKNKQLIEDADIVHCHDVFYWYFPFRFMYPKKPVYTTFHGYEGYPVSPKAIAVRKLSEKLSWGNICVGDFIPKWYGTRATLVTYGGVTMANSKWQMASSSKKKFTIVFVGRLDKDTGIDLYLKTLQELKKKKIPFVFEAYGDGKFRKQVEKVGKVHGFIEHLEKKLAKVDIVFSSSYLSMIQSLAAKKLVFAVYTNPLKEDYLRMSPFAKFVIKGDDPQKLAEKIIFYINQKHFAEKLITAGYTWAEKQTWDEVITIYLNLWKASIV